MTFVHLILAAIGGTFIGMVIMALCNMAGNRQD